MLGVFINFPGRDRYVWEMRRPSGCPHSLLLRSSAGLPWPSCTGAQGTARGGRGRRWLTRGRGRSKKWRVESKKCAHEYDRGWRYESAQDLSHEVCVCHHKLWKDAQCGLSACTPRVRWSAGALWQRRDWCRAWWAACCCSRRSNSTCDAAVRRALVLIAFHRSHCFHVAFPYPFFCIWR